LTLYTIGVYGWTAESFVQALRRAEVTSVIDIRRRRGVRGELYRFANATALEALLKVNGLGYIAEPRLAPTQEMRELQKHADANAGIGKRSRETLAPAFSSSYEQVLANYPKSDLEALLRSAGSRPALLCVERLPSACHRSLVATWISNQTGASTSDLLP
jgi:uncharacterized protein (DUF488 family)